MSINEWTLVLEYQPRAGQPTIACDAVHALLEELRLWHPCALYSPDRYALQLHVTASGPSDALGRGVDLHDEAAATVGVPAPVLVRTEVMTQSEFQGQWDAPAKATSSAMAVSIADSVGHSAGGIRGVLSTDAYWATRAILRAASASELVDIVTRFVTAVGGRVQATPAALAGEVVFSIALDKGRDRFAVVDGFSVSALILEQSLPTLLADARVALARLVPAGRRCPWQPAHVRTNIEHMFDFHCLDCPTDVTFGPRPGDAECSVCGLRMYVTAEGQLGRYVSEGWKPGGIQGYRSREA